MKFNIKFKSLKTILSVLTALTFVFIFMGAGKKSEKKTKQLRDSWGQATLYYGPPVPVRPFTPADVANPYNWQYSGWAPCQTNYELYPCTITIWAPEDSMFYYTDGLTGKSRLNIQTSSTDTAYVIGLSDSEYPDAPMEFFIANGRTPTSD